MKDRITQTLGGLLLALTFAGSVVAEDTDIFASGLQSSTTAPRILVVLDNTSNWARQSQQWPERRVCPDLSEWSDEPGFPYTQAQCPLIQEQQGQAEGVLELLQQVDHLCLHRHIERTDRFIANDQIRFCNERTRNADTLTLATGKFVGISIQVIRKQTYPKQHSRYPLIALLFCQLGTKREQWLTNDVGNRHSRVQ